MDKKVHDLLVSFIEESKAISKRQRAALISFEQRVSSLKESMVRIAFIRALVHDARNKPEAQKELLKQAGAHAKKVLQEVQPAWKLVDDTSHDLQVEQDALKQEQGFFVEEIDELSSFASRVSLASSQTIKKVRHRIAEFDEATKELGNENDAIRALKDLNDRHVQRLKSQALLIQRIVRILEQLSEAKMPRTASGVPAEDVLQKLSQRLLASLAEEQKNEIQPLQALMRKKISAQQRVFELVQRVNAPSFGTRMIRSLKSLTNLFSKDRLVSVADIRRDLQTLVLPSQQIDYVSTLLQHPELLTSEAIKFVGQMVQVFGSPKPSGNMLDPLFEPFNIQVFMRNHWERMANTEIKLAIRDGTPLSIVMLDIDHFKRINDTFGHQVGDIAIRDFGKICVTQTREHEPVGRYGGEEVVIVVRGNRSDAARAAERIRAAVEKHKIVLGKTQVQGISGHPIVDFTSSAGVASLDEDVSSETAREALELLRRGARYSKRVDEIIANIRLEIIEKADRRLYLAKEGGRNRVVSTSKLSA